MVSLRFGGWPAKSTCSVHHSYGVSSVLGFKLKRFSSKLRKNCNSSADVIGQMKRELRWIMMIVPECL